MSDDKKRLQELEQYKNRLQYDLGRIKSSGGSIGPNDPLRRNYNNVVQEISKLKK